MQSLDAPEALDACSRFEILLAGSFDIVLPANPISARAPGFCPDSTPACAPATPYIWPLPRTGVHRRFKPSIRACCQPEKFSACRSEGEFAAGKGQKIELQVCPNSFVIQIVQFSSERPGMSRKSDSLAVTRIEFVLIACAAIIRS